MKCNAPLAVIVGEGAQVASIVARCTCAKNWTLPISYLQTTSKSSTRYQNVQFMGLVACHMHWNGLIAQRLRLENE